MKAAYGVSIGFSPLQNNLFSENLKKLSPKRLLFVVFCLSVQVKLVLPEEAAKIQKERLGKHKLGLYTIVFKIYQW